MNAVMAEAPRIHRITVDEYHQMGELGILAPDARVELIDGVIVDMPPIGIKHSSAVDRLNYMFSSTLSGAAIVHTQGPVQLRDFSEPMPDLALLRFREDFYSESQARPEDVLLIVEVSDSSLSYDLKKKLALYARFGIPEYWIVDLKNRQLRVFRNPEGEIYADSSVPADLTSINISMLASASVDLTSLFKIHKLDQP